MKPPLFQRNDVIVHCYLARVDVNCKYAPEIERQIDALAKEIKDNRWWIDTLD
jgi:hypothetical protein